MPRESELLLVTPKYGRPSGDTCLREQKVKVNDLVLPLIPDEDYEGAMVLLDIIIYKSWNTLVKLLPHSEERGESERRLDNHVGGHLGPHWHSPAHHRSSIRHLRRPSPIFVSTPLVRHDETWRFSVHPTSGGGIIS